MKTSPLPLLALFGAWFAATACSHLDLAPDSDPSRVIEGMVTLRSDAVLPPDTVVVVRVIDTENREPMAGATDLPVMDRMKPVASERVLGQQTIKAPAGVPIPFRVEYTADDALLRRGLNVEARISYGGRVQYRTGNAHLVTLSSSNFPHEVWVEPASR